MSQSCNWATNICRMVFFFSFLSLLGPYAESLAAASAPERPLSGSTPSFSSTSVFDCRNHMFNLLKRFGGGMGTNMFLHAAAGLQGCVSGQGFVRRSSHLTTGSSAQAVVYRGERRSCRMCHGLGPVRDAPRVRVPRP